MAGIQIRLDPKTLDEIREIGKEFGETTDNFAIRLVISEYRRLKAENELLKIRLDECINENQKQKMKEGNVLVD